MGTPLSYLGNILISLLFKMFNAIREVFKSSPSLLNFDTGDILEPTLKEIFSDCMNLLLEKRLFDLCYIDVINYVVVFSKYI